MCAMDLNTVANEVYKANFPHSTVLNRNIESLTAKEVNNMKIDTILMSPPCQPFTRNGLQKDHKDNRTCALLKIIDKLPEFHSVKYILMENVVGFENSETRNKLVECLASNDFNYKELILSPNQFGVPNTRHRYYLLAKKKDLQFCFEDSTLENHLGKHQKRLLLKNIEKRITEKDSQSDDELGFELDRITDPDVPEKCYIARETLEKYVMVMDIRGINSRNTCCFTKAYTRYIEGTGSVYSDKFKEEVIRGELSKIENITYEDLKKYQLRFFTPREVASLMSFPNSFAFPSNITDKQKYKLFGNSLNPHVVSQLLILLHADSF